jgi:cryptochrome
LEADGPIHVPKLPEIFDESVYKQTATKRLKGGEQEALKVLESYLADTAAVAKFEKPKTAPTDFDPASTTCLSPYLKNGALSARFFYHRLQDVLAKHRGHTQPPVSLVGQLFWRELYYLSAYATPNFDRMLGNPICLQVPWRLWDGQYDLDPLAHQQLIAWKQGQTGYPWIDAVMTQLRTEGWIHHLARHAVACFLTRTLFISWEQVCFHSSTYNMHC